MVTNHTKEEFIELVKKILDIKTKEYPKTDSMCFCCGPDEYVKKIRILIYTYFKLKFTDSGPNTWYSLDQEAARVFKVNLRAYKANNGHFFFFYNEDGKLSYRIERSWKSVTIK